METNIQFEKILTAFLNATSENYFFLSKTIILHTTEISKEQLTELRQLGLIPLPHRSQEFDHKIKEEFVYEISDQKIAEKFFEVVTQKHPKKTFEELLKEFNFEQQFKDFEKKIIKNTLINWIVKTNVLLPGQKLIEQIEIKEADLKTIPDEMKTFTPTICNSCKNNTGFKLNYLKINQSCDNLLLEEELHKKLKQTYNLESYQFLGQIKKDLIVISKCEKCGSDNLEWEVR